MKFKYGKYATKINTPMNSNFHISSYLHCPYGKVCILNLRQEKNKYFFISCYAIN